MMFAAVIKAISDLINRRKAFVLLTPPHSVEFALVNYHDLEPILIKDNIERADYFRHTYDAAELLSAILSGQQEKDIIEDKIRKISKEEKDEGTRTQLEATLRERLKQVRGNLYTDQLQRRYDLKRTSKAPAFGAIDWDIKIKIDDAYRRNVRFPYATIKLKLQKEFGFDPYSILGGRTFDSVQVNFSGDELEYVKSVLDIMLASLREQEKEAKDQPEGQ